MRSFLLMLLPVLFLHAQEFAKNSECKQCHSQIYDEFSHSMHLQSTIDRDAIHKAVWDRHPAKKVKGQYVCAKCHTPAAKNLGEMIASGKKVLPDINDMTQSEGISCSYCHRIESIKKEKQSNTNVVSKKEHHYFGTLENSIKSDFHTVSTENENFANGAVCVGCHSHKANKLGFNVCETDVKHNNKKVNCISCHMPKVKGSVSNARETLLHSYHGFPGAHSDQDMLAKYLDINLEKNSDGFSITLTNHSTHALLLHPLRLTTLNVTIERDVGTIIVEPKVFSRIIGKDGKGTPPWLANSTVKDTQIQGHESRMITYKEKIVRGDIVKVELGLFLVNPQARNALGLEHDQTSKKFYRMKKKAFNIQ